MIPIKINCRRHYTDTGFSLVELMVAVSIMIIVSTTVAYSISVGMIKLQNLRIQRTANECARIVMEYFNTVPPDIIYGLGPSTEIKGDFNNTGIMALNTFVTMANSACRDFSDPTLPIGRKVKLAYSICPGCVAYTYSDPADPAAPPWTTCKYSLKVKVRYNIQYSASSTYRQKTIEYKKDLFGGKRYECYDKLGVYPQSVCATNSSSGGGGGVETFKGCQWMP